MKKISILIEKVREYGGLIIIESILIGIIIVLEMGLSKEMEAHYNRVVEKCNGKDNVIELYTPAGDSYYTCKNEN